MICISLYSTTSRATCLPSFDTGNTSLVQSCNAANAYCQLFVIHRVSEKTRHFNFEDNFNNNSQIAVISGTFLRSLLRLKVIDRWSHFPASTIPCNCIISESVKPWRWRTYPQIADFSNALVFCYICNCNCIIFTARCYAERGDATVCRLSVCDVQVPWSHRLEFFENNFTA